MTWRSLYGCATAALADARARSAVDATTLASAAELLAAVRAGGEPVLRELAARFDGWSPELPLRYDRAALAAAADALPAAERELLQRTAARIERFAVAQRRCLSPLATAVPGGRAGHDWLPIEAVGAYAPGGRYPLPSSVLMTVVPARVAGVRSIRVASPRPAPITLAAAAIAGADELLAVGGAHAIAALAFGVAGAPVDLVVGPGNRWVTAGKQLLVGEVGIDGLAGPSELLVLADDSGVPDWIAADLLAQAEHDPDARAILVTTSPMLRDRVAAELAALLTELPTAATAQAALARNGRLLLARDLPAAIAFANRMAPEHLQLQCANATAVARQLCAYGALFLGTRSAEVFGDYGIGPNHVLPTGGGARFQAGLSVATFLRPATWLEVDDPAAIAPDAAALAAHEGLHGHAAAARLRLTHEH